MATLPSPRSFSQILGEMLNSLAANLGIRKLKKGGPLLLMLENSARQDSKAAADIYNVLQATDLDNSTGLQLDRLGQDEKTPRLLKQKARGLVTISDTAFSKQSSIVSHSSSAPIVGSTYIYAEKGQTLDFAASTGALYLGRGTSNYEGPLTYTAKNDMGSAWRFTLSTPTSKFHNQGESVVIAQGGIRPINAGAVVSTPSGATTSSISYSVISSTNIPDGENEVTDVAIIASLDGSLGNAPANSVSSFQSPPFATATVTNPTAISSGRDTEKDPEYRERIRHARDNKARANTQAIKDALIGVYSPIETSSIISSSVYEEGAVTKIVIDDGNGYEERSEGQGYEVLCSSATGGEKTFKTISSPIAQCYLETQNTTPFQVIDGTSLTVVVGGISTTHTFDTASFSSTNASSYDIVTSINSNPSLKWSARTSDNASRVSIFAKSETNDDLYIISNDNEDLDANTILGFNTQPTFTTSIYKNDVELNKDGTLAQVLSNQEESWGSISGSPTLTINVDGTGEQTYTFTDTDFAPYTGYVTRGNAQIWSEIINKRIPGVTAVRAEDKISLTSNRGYSANASIEIVGGTLVGVGVFNAGLVSGKAADYTIDRAVGAITLKEPLVAGDTLTLGTNWPEGFIETQKITDGIVLSTDSSYWMSIDDPNATLVADSFNAYPLSTSVSSVGTSAYITSVNAPLSCLKGDWVLFNDAAFPDNWKNINFRTSNTTIEVEVKGGTTGRFGHTATALVPESGALSKVLIVGGFTTPQAGFGLPGAIKGRGVATTCDIYNPNTGAWTTTSDMVTPRAYHTATLLDDGKVYVCGGYDAAGAITDTAEIYDPDLDTWTAVLSLPTARVYHTAHLLSSGRVLLIGGASSSTTVLSTSVEYNPGSNAYVNTSSMGSGCYGHRSVLLSTGNVVIMGGISTIASPATAITTTKLYTTSSNTWSGLSAMPSGRAFFGAAVTTGDKITVIGDMAHNTTDNSFSNGYSRTTFTTYSGGSWSADTAINTGSSWSANQDVRCGQMGLAVSANSSTVVCALPSVCTDTINGAYSTNYLKWDNSNSEWDRVISSNPITGLEGNVGVALTGLSTDKVCFFGGVPNIYTNEFVGAPISTTEIMDATTNAFTWPIAGFTSTTLDEGRLIVARSETPPQKATVGTNSGTAYLSSALSDTINANDILAETAVYKTSYVRLSTPTLDDGAVLQLDLDSELPEFGSGTSASVRSQLAITKSQSHLCVPSDFELKTIQSGSTTAISVPQYSTLKQWGSEVDPNTTILGLKSYPSGRPTNRIENYGNLKNTRGIAASIAIPGTSTDLAISQIVNANSTLALRSTAVDYFPGHPIALVDPFKFAYSDKVTVTVDGDPATKRFVIPMARKLVPNDANYGNTIYLKDADNGNAQLQAAFGSDYDFNDFVLLSRARTVSDPLDDTKRTLWRYNRYGAEGNYVGVRIMNPLESGATTSFSVNTIQDYAHDFGGRPQVTVDIHLPAGSARNNALLPTSKFGLVTTQSLGNGVYEGVLALGYKVILGNRVTGANVTTLRIELPFGITNSGIQAGDVLYYKGDAPSPTTLLSGQFKVNSVLPPGAGYQDIIVSINTLHDGTSAWLSASNPGTISLCPTSENYFDNNTVPGDWVYVNDVDTAIYSSSLIQSSRIVSINASYQSVQFIFAAPGTTISTSTTMYYYNIPSGTSATNCIQVWAKNNPSISTLVSTINSLIGCPVSAIFTGTTPATIDRATWDTDSDFSSCFRLTDGVNWVQTTVAPGGISSPTGFTLKKTVDSTLVATNGDNDFVDEIFYITPAFAKDVVKWLNTYAITGLSTAASIKLSNYGEKVQIASNTLGKDGSILVEGGKGNVTTVNVLGEAASSTYNQTPNAIKNMVLQANTSETEGLTGGHWVWLRNSSNTLKTTNASSFWGGYNQILSIGKDGKFVTQGVCYNPLLLGTEYIKFVTFEKIGGLTAVVIPKGCNLGITAPTQSCYVKIEKSTGTASETNCGIFKVLRVTENESAVTLWIDNPNTTEEQSLAGIVTMSSDSLIPGDIISVRTEALGATNKRDWVVTDVGNNYTNSYLGFTVDITEGFPAAFSGSATTSNSDIPIYTGTPMKGIKKVVSIINNGQDPTKADIVLDDVYDMEHFSESAGTIIEVTQKLGFAQTTITGNDAYRYNIGLIAEAKRLIYGDKADAQNTPGYAANGVSILFGGPVVKRLKIAVALRLNSNISNQNIIDRVRSAIAGYINSQPHGQNIPISGIVAAVESVDGVSSVSMISPTYNSSNDLILVMANEKAMIVDSEGDISITTIGI